MRILLPLLYDSHNTVPNDDLIIELVADRIQLELGDREIQVSKFEFLQVSKLLEEESNQ